MTIENPGRGSMRIIHVMNNETGDARSYQVSLSNGIRVEEGQHIPLGEALTEGALNPHDVLRILGTDAVHAYLIKEVQRVYRQQGVDISDKHIEVIVRQMMRKVKIEDEGDTGLLPGSLVDIIELRDENRKVEEKNAAGEVVSEEEPRPFERATYQPMLLGITKASLATDSFLSAASFQETTRVLTEAAIKGKIDPLSGLKENVIIGKLIPAGTGMAEYREGGYEETVELAD